MAGSRGFTFIELVIVLAIAGIVIAFSVPVVGRYVERSRVAEATTVIATMSDTIRRHGARQGALPDGLADVGLAGKLDPWGFPYEYFNLIAAKGNGQARRDKKLAPLNSDFDLYSVGRDGLTASSLGNSKSRDDVVRARDGRFIGTAEEFDP